MKACLSKEELSKSYINILLVFIAFIITLAFDARPYYFPTALTAVFVLAVARLKPLFGQREVLYRYIVFIFLSVSALTYIGVEVWNGSGFSEPPDGQVYRFVRAILNYLLTAFVIGGFCVLTGRMRSGIRAGIILWNFMGFANAVIYQFKGSVLLPIDLLAIQTAVDVADGYSLVINANMVFALLLLCVCWTAAGSIPDTWDVRYIVPKPRRIFTRVIAGLFVLIFFTAIYGLDTERFYYAWWKEHNGYPFNIAMNLKMLNVKKPKGYKAQDIAAILKEGAGSKFIPSYDADAAIKEAFPDYYKTYGAKPVIIGIMNESFTDLSDVGQIETDQPLFENITALKDRMISGKLYTEVYGGGTSDSEYTFLTGNSTILFAENARAYQLYVKEENSSLARSLKNEGYETFYMHPERASNWNRANIFEKMGFQGFYSAGNDKDDPETNVFYGLEMVRDEYYSDGATYQYIERIYEAVDRPFFVFDVTMQNHGNYLKSYNNLEKVNILYPEGDFPMAEQFVSLIRASDIDFAELIDYFEEADRPVLICMFGDHQPKLDEGFYDVLSGTQMNDWSPEQSQNQQITPFMIWSNYELPFAEFNQMSINYLGALMTECSGTPMTLYQQYEAWLYRQYPVINKKGVICADGSYLGYNELTGENQKRIDAYKDVLYNNIDGGNEREASFYTIQP